jgi:hypothetical protein
MFSTPDIKTLEEDVRTLFNKHSARNPQTKEVQDAIESVSRLEFSSGDDRARGLMIVSRLLRAQSKPLDALRTYLDAVEVTRNRKLKAKVLLAVSATAKELLTKKYSRQISDSSANREVTSIIRQIIAAEGDSDDATQLRVYLSLLTRDALAAIHEGHTAAAANPKYLPDFIAVIGKMMARSDFDRLAPVVGRAIKDLSEQIVAAGQYAFLAGVRLKFNGKLVEDGWLSPLTLTEIEQHLENASSEEVRSLARDKTLFLYEYPQCEEIKQCILERYYSLIVQPEVESKRAKSAKAYLEQSAKTVAFWQDRSYRDLVVTRAVSSLVERDSPEARMVLGIVNLLEGNDKEAEHHFRASIVADTLYAKTGATSFRHQLSQADRKRFTEKRADYSGVKKTDTALVVCADVKYFNRYARVYCGSLRDLGSNARVHFHLSANSRAEAEQAFKAALGDFANVSMSSEDNSLSYTRMPTYYASMRFLQAPNFLRNVASRVFLTDIDVLFREDPTAVMKSQSWVNADVGFRIYDRVRVLSQSRVPNDPIMRFPRLLPWSQVNAAFLAIFDTPRGHRIAERIADDMHRHLGRALTEADSAWWVDQNSLRMSLIAAAEDPAVQIVNIEDVGMPYGVFLYSARKNLPGDLGVFYRR